jgi:excisionase family DNA binding protein
MDTPDPRDQDELLPVAQCVTELNVSARTMENVIASGEIPVVRIARRVRRIRRSDLDAYIARVTTRVTATTSEPPS